uniref:Vesicle transport protein n=1 Tax=Taenia asiatica TaxID=60517 RepID=A0A0R3W6Z8_TAEAS
LMSLLVCLLFLCICFHASTFFLMGPVKQCKRMFAESRIVAALLFLVFLVLTIVSAVVTPLCLLFSILQFLALTWYSLSFIPYAR